ncbi:MAG: hypothetical protein D6775_14875 [Caldilineae bacterium]|nr:MAG: hypothetical protein D6775_14875 [Caldilineae bacterium]
MVLERPSPSANGRVALYSENARDGSLTLLAWVNVRFALPETIASASILEPQEGAKVKGSVRVSGTAQGLRDAQLLVQAEDLAGTVWGKAKVAVSNDGTWEVRLRVQRPTTARDGRITVYEVGDGGERPLLASVEVQLAR